MNTKTKSLCLLCLLVACSRCYGQNVATAPPEHTVAPEPAKDTSPESDVVASAVQDAADALIVVVGASGKPEYRDEFNEWATQWESLAKRQRWPLEMIRSDPDLEATPKSRLEAAINRFSSNPRIWIVLLGHGTYSAGKAKFNLPGPDITSKEMAAWLKDVSGQVIAINCSSSSSPFISDLGAAGRIVVTATRSGNEVNFSRFGRFIANAVNDLSVDIDHDKEVSLLEAFLAATAQTERFYEEDARLTTEHALLDDNGDRAGISADFYRGIRPVKKPANGGQIDGSNAARVILMTSPDNPVFSEELNQERLKIESQIDSLRNSRPTMIESEYLNRLEKLMLLMSDVYDKAEESSKEKSHQTDSQE